MKPHPSAQRLTELFKYIPKTGEFIWRVPGPNRRGIAGTTHVKGYRQIRIDGILYMAHRVAWMMTYGCWPAGQLDHINGDKADNRITNLREATNGQNKANTFKAQKNSISGIKGVHQWRSDRWTAQIRADGKRYYLGSFKTPEEARMAYADAAARYFGEFAQS